MRPARCKLATLFAFACVFSSSSAAAAVPATPRLEISRTNDQVALSWPSSAIYFKPWNATNLNSSVFWSAVTNTIAVTNTRCSVTLGLSNRPSFFRLMDSQPSLSTGLVAHYTFDEPCTDSAAGCVQDSSGLGNHGTLGSAISGTLPQAPIWTANGRFAGAYLYSGIVQPAEIIATIGEGIYLPQGVDVDGDWTLSVWAKLNNVTNHTSSMVYCQKQSTEDCRNLLIHWEGDADQTMTLQVRDSACHELILHNLPTNPMVAGQWYHLVGVGTNKTYSFYINGMLQQSQHVSNMGSLSSDSHTIGTMFDNGGLYYNHYMNGAIDELRIYNRALSVAEILALYNQSGGSP
jgi:concanavalin A-like lectin/glucanase superfamily protein